jgi:hypothetical protein
MLITVSISISYECYKMYIASLMNSCLFACTSDKHITQEKNNSNNIGNSIY